ncbi:MAG: methylenetetrahydrofolate reductase [NAD(P)H] [Opitutales bacterium]
MAIGRPISERFDAGKPVISVEFFPPKNEAGARQILRTAAALRPLKPDFVSITYGAGGSTRTRTIEYGELLKDIFDFEVMPHLTCVGHSRDDLREILARFHAAGFRNIMTLRGDPPKGDTEFKPHPDGLAYASELVELIRQEFPDFCLGVGGYPEKHPEAPSFKEDLNHLKKKVDAGGHFITTQLFFDNADYFTYVEACREIGIETPVLPGILPPVSHAQLEKFTAFCESKYPDALRERMLAAGGDEEAAVEVGIDWAFAQMEELLERGAPGVHLYILNRQQAAITLIERLRQRDLLPAGA